MKRLLTRGATLLATSLLALPAFAADGKGLASNLNWPAQSLGKALAHMGIFAAIGIAVAVIGYKVFDKCTPGDLHKEIIENKNTAAAIVGAAVILGVCIIIAAAMS